MAEDTGSTAAGLIPLGSTQIPKLDIPLDALGAAGTRAELHVLAIMSNETRSNEERLADTARRTFCVSATLSKQPPASGDLKGDFLEGDGSSYFLAHKGTDQYRIDTTACFHIRTNALGEMALIEFECEAESPAEAQANFAEAVYPFLDHLSYATNVPVHISRLRVEDRKNGRTTVAYTAPFRSRAVGSFVQQLAIEMKPVYSMYREARNASSDFYRFLCFYKILEGLLGKMRAAVYQRAKAQNVKLPALRDLVPPSDEYRAELKEHVGRSIRQFFDTVLQPEYRNAMAHFATDGGAVLHLSDYAHQQRYANIMLILEYCVRTVIAKHEMLLQQLK